MVGKIAYITTCKGRLHHLRVTLPLMLAQNPDEVVVVDYGCPDGAADWVSKNYPQVRVIVVDDDSGFCIARARNFGAKASSADWLCFSDADIKMAPGFNEWLKYNLNKNSFYIADSEAKKADVQIWGTVICHRSAFDNIDGYDEAFRGWGGEDDDFYCQLGQLGIHKKFFPSDYLSSIPHDDSERTQFYDIKNKSTTHKINHVYREVKYLINEQIDNESLPVDQRVDIVEQIKRQFGMLDSNVEYPISKIKLPSGKGGLVIPRKILITISDKLKHYNRVIYHFENPRRYIIFGPKGKFSITKIERKNA